MFVHNRNRVSSFSDGYNSIVRKPMKTPIIGQKRVGDGEIFWCENNIINELTVEEYLSSRYTILNNAIPLYEDF